VHRGYIPVKALALLLAVPLLAATPAKYQECKISVGQVFSCKGTGFNGTAVIEATPGKIKTCQIAVGQVTTCGAGYTGTAVLLRDGKYRSCRVAAGTVTSCEGTGFNGMIVVRH
jgi:hypothetical protein